MIQALRFQLLFLVIFLHALPATSQISTANLSNIYQDKMQERAEKRFIKQGKHIFSIYATKTQYPLVLKDPLHNPVILTHQSGDIDPPQNSLVFGWRLY